MSAQEKADYMREYRKRYRQTPEGKAKKQEGNRRWKKSENGKKASREYLKKKYIPSSRIKLTPEERKARDKASNLRSINRPGYKEKMRETQWRCWLRKGYGLTVEQFNEMAKNGCQICGAGPTTKKRLHVDHDHVTGKVRGVLCDPCNRGLGCFRDDTGKLFKALLYLRRA